MGRQARQFLGDIDARREDRDLLTDSFVVDRMQASSRRCRSFSLNAPARPGCAARLARQGACGQLFPGSLPPAFSPSRARLAAKSSSASPASARQAGTAARHRASRRRRSRPAQDVADRQRRGQGQARRIWVVEALRRSSRSAFRPRLLRRGSGDEADTTFDSCRADARADQLTQRRFGDAQLVTNAKVAIEIAGIDAF
jgi:hypothetical protein